MPNGLLLRRGPQLRRSDNRLLDQIVESLFGCYFSGQR